MNLTSTVSTAALAVGLALATPALVTPASATTIVTSLAAFQAGIGGAKVTTTANPGAYDLTQLFLPTTITIALNDGSHLGLSNMAQVTQPQNGFPYILSDGFGGELFIPEDANGNQVSTETITVGGLSALGFEIAPFSAAAGAPYIGFKGGPYTITFTLANGQTTSTTLPGANMSGVTQSAFFGFVGGGVSSLTVSTSDPNGLAFGNFADVPEPASIAVMLLGLAGLAGLVRSRSNVG